MANTFAARQLYKTEDLVNQIADVLVHVGFEVGEEADKQNWDGKAMADMSGVLERLVEAETNLSMAVGLVRAYELFRQAQAVVA
jgi:hypothetical protein